MVMPCPIRRSRNPISHRTKRYRFLIFAPLLTLILYSFLLYPLHKIFSHLQNKKVRNNVFCIKKIDFWHRRSGRSWLSYPITFLRMSTYPDKKNKDGCCQLGFSVSLIFHKNNKSVSAKIITGLSLSILSAEKGQNFLKLWCSF